MRAVVSLASWVVLAAFFAIVAPPVRPLDSTLHGVGNAVAVGCLAGAGVFVLLARRAPPAAALAAIPGRRLAARSIILTAVSAKEEALWRGLVLGMLAGPVGRPLALTLSTLLFAAVHVRGQGRAAAAHLWTGLTFGLAYLVTGRLAAAIVAHATYNVLVGASSLATESLSVSDTGRVRRASLASRASHVARPMPNPTPQPPVAELAGVVKTFGPVCALDDVDLRLEPGEIVALLGPNGAGKTTAVAMLLGLRRPDRGRVTLLGRDPRTPAARLGIGAVLQDIGFPPAVRVREVVELVRAHFPAAAATEQVLDRVGLANEAGRDAAGLSGGQRRRLAVGLALVGDPKALFLDEPTAGLDAGARRTLLGDIVAFAKGGGAVLLTTQQLAEAEEIASRVVLLVRGRVMLEGSVAEVRARGGHGRVTFRAPMLPPLPGIVSVDTRADRHVVYVEDADRYVAALVHAGTPFHDLEVARPSLEDAFVTLTGEEAR